MALTAYVSSQPEGKSMGSAPHKKKCFLRRKLHAPILDENFLSTNKSKLASRIDDFFLILLMFICLCHSSCWHIFTPTTECHNSNQKESLLQIFWPDYIRIYDINSITHHFKLLLIQRYLKLCCILPDTF